MSQSNRSLTERDKNKSLDISRFRGMVFFVLFCTTFIFFCPSFIPTVHGQSLQSPVFDFNRDLTLGSTGLDVYSLQVFLNRDPDTRLATSGAGSPGQETEYYGPITRNAVIRFQEKYASEILTPLGLSRGTGYFGPSTRAKIKSILSAEQKKDPVSKSEAPKTPESITEEDLEFSLPSGTQGMYTDELMLTRPSYYYGKKGTVLNLYGFGFTSDNTVYFGDKVVIKNVRAESYDTIKITVPLDIDLGYHEIQIENEGGRTTDSSVFFVVIDEDSTLPRIDSVYPPRGGWGTEVTVHGEGFDNDWNMIRAPYGTIGGLTSPDGKTITFKIEPFPEIEGIGKDVKIPDGPWEWEIRFFIVNDGGVSQEPGSFILDL